MPVSTNYNEPANFGYNGDLEDRAIRSDPRENWYLSLPEKIVPQQAVNILRAALAGDIWQQYMLLRLMEDRWPTFRMAAHQLREAVSYSKFNVMPHCEEGEEPTETAKAKAGLVTRAMKSFSPNPFSDEKGCSGMIYDFTNAMLMGISLNELVWQRKRSKEFGEEMLPRASAFVHPRHFTFSNNGEVAVFSDDYARMMTDPRFNATNTRNPILKTAPDPDKFICSQFMSMSGSCLGAGFMRPLVWAFIARIWCNEWALNTAKNYGSPFIDVTYKAGQSDATERAKLAQFLKNAGAERRLIHPEGTVAQIHPAQSLGADNPQRYLIDESDKLCLYLLLGQTSTTQATPGKLGDDSTKSDTKEERVAGICSWVARNPLRQFARAVLRQNYGDDSECPEFVPDRGRPLGCAEVSTLVSSINGSGLPVRADEFYKKIGFSQPEPGDLIVQRGEVTEMLTEEEKYEQQIQQAQDQMELQQQAAGVAGQEVEASSRTTNTDPRHLLPVIQAATPEQLRQLEEAVTAAEQAPHRNGELKRVEELIGRLS